MTLTSSNITPEAFPHQILSRDYSDKELQLIKDIWVDTKQVAQQKMQLCLHLYELKQEMDDNDPSAGRGNNGQSRFWTAFERGDLPEYVANNRKRAEEWLTAAAFAASGEFPGASGNSILALTPSTVCNLARIKHPEAKAIAEQHLRTHDFIGHDASAYLAKTELDNDVLAELQIWIAENDTKALVPSVIRKVEQEVRLSNQPASTRVVNASTAERQAAAFEEIQADLKKRAPQIAADNRVAAVKEELSRGERDQLEKRQELVRQYNSKLNSAVASVEELLQFLKSIDRTYGTEVLSELRTIDVQGLLSVADDIARIKATGASMLQIAELATSSNPPSGIDMTTFDIDAE